MEREYADALTAALYAKGRKADALHRRGICEHGWFQGPRPWEQGEAKCLHCGKVFPSTAALMEEHRELLA